VAIYFWGVIAIVMFPLNKASFSVNEIKTCTTFKEFHLRMEGVGWGNILNGPGGSDEYKHHRNSAGMFQFSLAGQILASWDIPAKSLWLPKNM